MQRKHIEKSEDFPIQNVAYLSLTRLHHIFFSSLNLVP